MNAASGATLNNNPTPLPDLVAALKRVSTLQGLAEHEYEWLARNGTERCVAAGLVIFHEGDPASHMTILLRGEIHVRRERGGPAALFIGRSGVITGLLPFSRMKAYGGMGVAAADVWELEYDKALFPEMLAAIPKLAPVCVGILLDRVREVTRMEQQSEKLTALGKLAGNLAHELNNPASAAQRAAGGMLDEMRVYGREKFKLGRLCLSDEKLAQLREWEDSLDLSAAAVTRDASFQLDASGVPAADAAPAENLSLAESEDALQQWLQKHGVDSTWKIAPELAEQGISVAQLEPLAGVLEPQALSVMLSQFASSLRTRRIAEAMLDSTGRIFGLIRAIKDYSYMDQAPIQNVDIPQGLENTLSMLQSRLKNVTLERDYEPDLPLISAYGSELNQVWMALIENALDAMHDAGTLKLSCHASGDMMLIEVWDTGPGIPEELQDRIFEPFFTTKATGSALGLGLDTVMRIVRIHRGFVTVQSKPGATCFQVRLPLEQLQAY